MCRRVWHTGSMSCKLTNGGQHDGIGIAMYSGGVRLAMMYQQCIGMVCAVLAMVTMKCSILQSDQYSTVQYVERSGSNGDSEWSILMQASTLFSMPLYSTVNGR
jgi:hypothetical protein